MKTKEKPGLLDLIWQWIPEKYKAKKYDAHIVIYPPQADDRWPHLSNHWLIVHCPEPRKVAMHICCGDRRDNSLDASHPDFFNNLESLIDRNLETLRGPH